MWKRVPCWQGCLFLFSPQAPPCVRTVLLESSQRHQVYLHCFGVLNLALMGYCMRDVGDEFSHVLNWYKTSSQGFPPPPVTWLYFSPVWHGCPPYFCGNVCTSGGSSQSTCADCVAGTYSLAGAGSCTSSPQRIHNYIMFFWIGKWRKHRSVSTNNLLVPYTHTLSLYIHTYIHTYIHMNVKTSPLLTRVPLSVLTSGATVCTNCPVGKFSETPGVFTLFWCIESCADGILYARRWRRVLSRIELVQD